MPAQTAAARDRSSSAHLLAIITGVVIVAALYFGKDLVIPFALAVLLSFLLSTPVIWLERLHLGRPVSVLLVLCITLLLAGGLLWLGMQQLSGIAANLPHYRAHILRKMEMLRSPAGSGVVTLAENVKLLTNELGAHQSPEERNGHSRVQPLPVEIVRGDRGLISSLGVFSASIVHYLGLLVAVSILTLFMLLNRGHLRNRLFRLMGQGHLVLMTTALDEAAQKVSRYLLTQSLVNSSFGTLLGFGLWMIGVPYAPFWGVLAAFLRFVPYVGTFVAGACPFVLALAVFDGWSKPLMTVTLFAALEATVSALIEPWLYATRTGVSSLAILFSAAFWTLLWGPIGLLLSTPLTVCLAVLGRHVKPLNFLHVLLGDEPVLTPEVSYYQRLLAMDEEEAVELAERYLKEKSLVELYDEVLIPALGLAEQDRHEDHLEEHRVEFLYKSTRDLLEELGERMVPSGELGLPPVSALCVPVRDEADELIALMLTQTLQQAGCDAHHSTLGNVEELLKPSSHKVADVVILSALPPSALLSARALCRQLHRYHPTAKIVLGIWNSSIPAEKIRERLGSQCVDAVAISIQEAKEQLQSLVVPAHRTVSTPETIEREQLATNTL